MGGSNFTGGYTGRGTVFKITTNGTFTPLVFFNGTNGSEPAGLSLGSDHNFYGVTTKGGAYDYGSVFRMTSGGTLATLFSFNGTNGYRPWSGVTEGRDGRFYGATPYHYAGAALAFGTLYS